MIRRTIIVGQMADGYTVSSGDIREPCRPVENVGGFGDTICNSRSELEDILERLGCTPSHIQYMYGQVASTKSAIVEVELQIRDGQSPRWGTP
jgi:hypothetical protein